MTSWQLLDSILKGEIDVATRERVANAAEEKGSLDEKEFDVLVELARHAGEKPTQRELAAATDLSVGTVNRVLSQLRERGLVAGDGSANDESLRVLEPYRARRAILLAAGFGSRLVPVTLTTPKPLIRVRGTRIIDTLLDAVVAAGIEEIYVVRGYLAETFDSLLEKYPMIRFVENPLYNETNNISSALAVRDKFENAYVFESDLLLRTPDLVTRYQYASNYVGVPVDKTDDWCFPSKRGIITGMELGGVNCHHMFGFSYWTTEDGRKLAEDIPRVIESPGGREKFWDKVPLECCADHYRVRIRNCTFDDITEIDTVRELCALDPSYCEA